MKQKIRMTCNDTMKWTYEGKKYCLHVIDDESPESPRNWDNLATLACWHKFYKLGDDIGKTDASDYFATLVFEMVPEKDVVNAVLDGSFKEIEIEKRNDGLYDLRSGYREYREIDEEAIVGYILEELSVNQMISLLKPYAEILPLWLYDHGGISISCGSRRNPYNDRWDSGCVGFAILSKDKVMNEACGYVLDENGNRIKEWHTHTGSTPTWGYKTCPLTEDTWRDRASEIIHNEVEEYDKYLTGDVYGFKLLEEEDGEWNEIDSCFGFYGADILENGIADSVGSGLLQAIEREDYEEGTAKLVVKKSYCY